MCAAGGEYGGNESGEEKEDGVEEVPGPCPAKKKRLVSYNKKWEETHSWVKPVSGELSRVFCNLCRREFSVGHGGENEVKKHASTEIHKRAQKK